MVLGYGFINDCSCCPVTSGCCCPDVNAGTFNLTYTIESDCAAFDSNTGCLIRGSDSEGCTIFSTNSIIDNGNCSPDPNINMQAVLKCWSLTERTGYPPTDPNVIPPKETEYGYRLCITVSNSDCTGVPNEILGDVDSGCYKPVKNLFILPQCDPFEVIFDVPAPYNRPANGLPAGTACGCCDEGDNIRFIITSGTC